MARNTSQEAADQERFIAVCDYVVGAQRKTARPESSCEEIG
jgi:hypothetical protein